MKSRNPQLRRAAEDRASLRDELTTAELSTEEAADGNDRVHVFDALAAEADEEEAPPMPDDLRDRLIDKFGGQSAGVAAPVRLSWAAKLKAMFAERPLAFGGGLAAAACVLFVLLNPPGGNDGIVGTGSVDTLRGGEGNGGAAAVTASEVKIYLHPSGAADKVRALMNPDRAVTFCADSAELATLLAAQDEPWAVAADAQSGSIVTYHHGAEHARREIAGADPMEILLGLHEAIDTIP